jgi:hypothetical protein
MTVAIAAIKIWLLGNAALLAWLLRPPRRSPR